MGADSALFQHVNDFARATPWLHGPILAYATYGVVLFGGLLLAGLWLARRRASTLFLTPARFEAAERLFAHHGGKIVTVARFVEGLRQLNGIIAGTTSMPWRRVLACNALGAALWVAVWAGLGYLTGNHIAAIYDQIHRYQPYVLTALAVLLVAVLAHRLLRRRHTPETNNR
jgi:membrane protein DedA with SNARE-associated domain